MESNTHKHIWDAYGKSWSETDTSKRLQLFEQTLSPEVVYTDPTIQTTGYAELSRNMSEFQKNVPGAKFVVTDFKSHHGRSLAHWNMVDGQGNILGQGASFGLYGADGRLTQMAGFFELPDAD